MTSSSLAVRLLVVALAAGAPALAGRPSDRAITFALAGDAIVNRRLSVHDAPGFDTLIERIRGADAAFVNFETLIHDFDLPGEAQSGGAWMGSAPWVADELKWAGFDLFSLANNHTFDFGVEGMRSTVRALAQAGVTFSGTGENLARARGASYLDTPKGRVALISLTSTFPPASAAGRQRIDLRGRPSPASEPQARAILERLDALSQPFGSRVTYQDGIGVLTWTAAGESTASR